MSVIHWKSDVSGNFDTAADWTGGVVPGTSDDVVLSATGTLPYTVSVTDSHTVASVRTNARATLSIAGGVFSATNGTGGGTNYGTIAVADGAWFEVGGAFVNQNGARGLVSVNGAGSATGLIIAATGASFTNGRMTLDDEAANAIVGTLSGPAGSQTVSTLTNSGSISGAGDIGANLAVVNSGVIDATDSAALIVAPDNSAQAGQGTLINTGTLEATSGTGGLTLMGGTSAGTLLGITNTGGVIEAVGAGSHVDLTGVTLTGGTLKTSSGGAINITGYGLYTQESTAISATVENFGSLSINDVVLNVDGTVSGSGVINARYSYMELDGNTALSGHGVIDLFKSGPSGASIFSYSDASAPTLSNVDDTIQGGGTIGADVGNDGVSDGINLVNGAAGVVDAVDLFGTRFGGQLTIDTATNTIVNRGLMEASATGLLSISDPGGGALDNTGTLEADGGTVYIDEVVLGNGSAVITNGGTLEFARLTSFGENITFTNGTGELRLEEPGAIALTGTLSGFSSTGGTEIRIDGLKFTGAGEATFSGTSTSGVLTISDGTATDEITLLGDYLATTFVTASTGGFKGVIVTAMMSPASAAPPVEKGASPQAFVAAMASVGATMAAPIRDVEARTIHALFLASPRSVIA